MNEHCSRKEALNLIVLLPAMVSAIVATRQVAAATNTQASVKYQNKPKGNQKCNGCRFFVPNKGNPKANGTCTIVQGAISPNGWCTAYVKT